MPTSDKKVTVKLVRSPIRYNHKQRLVLQSLGLGKMNTTATHSDTATIRGMINTVIHMVEVTEG